MQIMRSVRTYPGTRVSAGSEISGPIARRAAAYFRVISSEAFPVSFIGSKRQETVRMYVRLYLESD